MNNVLIRAAIASEQKALEALQLRASLSNPGDREALLANPDAIELPLDQIAAERVFVAMRDGAMVGFAAILPRETETPNSTAYSLSRTCGGRAWEVPPLPRRRFPDGSVGPETGGFFGR